MLHVLLTLGQPHHLVYVTPKLNSNRESLWLQLRSQECFKECCILPAKFLESLQKDNKLKIYIYKIPKNNLRAYIFQRPFLRRLFLEGLMYGGKFTVFLCVALYLRAISKYIWRGDLTEGFLRYEFGLGGGEGLIFGGAYTLMGLFSEFYGISVLMNVIHEIWSPLALHWHPNDGTHSQQLPLQLVLQKTGTDGQNYTYFDLCFIKEHNTVI